jgi:hypothetical protein
MYQNCHKIPSGHTYNMPNGLKYTKWQWNMPKFFIPRPLKMH